MNNDLVKLVILILLTGCSTSRDYFGNGKKYYENGLYYKALEELTLGVKKDPNNPDLNIALKKTQDKVFELELLKVRDTREAGDPLKALAQVREVDKKMEKWNIKTDIDGSRFRKAEVSRLFFSFNSYINSFLDKNQILKAHALLISYSDILSPLQSYNTLMETIRKKGQQKCDQLKENPSPFFNKFISNYCDFFGVPHNLKYSVDDYKYNFKISKINGEIGSNYLDNSPIFSVNSPNYIESDTSIKFHYAEEKTNAKKSVDYRDRESYWATEVKTTWITEYYWTTQLECNYLNKLNPCQNKKVQKTRVVPKYHNIRVKKYRSINKTYTYTILNVLQEMQMDGLSKIFLNGKKYHVLKHHHKETYSDYGHNNTFSKANIRPKQLHLKKQSELMEILVKKIGLDIKDWFEKRWIQKYCVAKGEPILQREYVMRCSLLNDKYKEVDSWSLNYTGLTFVTVKKILRL